MFGGHRKKVTDQTIQMVRQPYALFQNTYGIPQGFWQDEFVLGFFGVKIGLVSQALGQGRLSTTDKGRVLQDTFTALSNMNGEAIARRFGDFAREEPQSADFRLGCDNGEIVTLAAFGKGTPQGRAAIEEAKSEAAAQGRPGDVGAVATILAMKLFVGPLVERFGLEDT